VSQDQHFLPQVYLRQWCQDGRVLRYRRVGPERRLEAVRKSPRGVAFEPDLYSVPVGGAANGLTGNELEVRLASDVDARLPALVQRVSLISGELRDEVLRGDVVWLMQTFCARNPNSIARVQDGVGDFVKAQRPTIERMLARANTESARTELLKYLAPRMPAVAARAGLAAVVDRNLPSDLRWLDGDVHVVPFALVAKAIRSAGACEFVTFEDPVVAWDANSNGLVASFSMLPGAMVLVAARGGGFGVQEYADAALRHLLIPPGYRGNLICRTELSSHVLAAAGRLRPSDDAGP